SFSGSASYDAASGSGELTVTPAAAFPYWIALIAALAVLAAVLMIWRKKRKEVRPARKVRRSKSEVS
ncbi:MAG: hypothetical protein COT21_01240, partial [Hadesarchaea archaeon CG08_land_8_20_14_0_20_51_8]